MGEDAAAAGSAAAADPRADWFIARVEKA